MEIEPALVNADGLPVAGEPFAEIVAQARVSATRPEIRKQAFPARFPQLAEVGLREALLLADEFSREWNVLDGSAAMQIVEAERGLACGGATGIDGCGGHSVERRCVAAADIEHAAAIALVQEPEIRIHHIVDVRIEVHGGRQQMRAFGESGQGGCEDLVSLIL